MTSIYRKTSHGFLARAKKDFKINKLLYLMALPTIAYFIIFHYIPMYGVTLAFKVFSPAAGFAGGPWIGLDNFRDFFDSIFAWRVIRNTLYISFYSIIFGFPAPIILALMVNEIKNRTFKRSIQTISYLPHFVSIMVVAGIIVDFSASDGIINNYMAMFFNTDKVNLLRRPELFRSIYIISGIWQGIGFGSIIYLASISSIDPALYEASFMDGAGRFRQAISITIPGILPTIVILLILRIGSLMSVGFEKIILLYNPSTYKTADVISSFVYRKGLLENNYGYATAVGFFNSVINFILLIGANMFSRKFSETSLW